MANTVARSELSDWLDEHGLGQYGEAMAEQDIDLETLRELDDADLREIGISIGHRKILRRALEADRARDAAAGPAERRQLSILFCDLVGSTGIARKYDAEDLAIILQRYQACCSQIIDKWQGHSFGTQGDGVVAGFGYPKAQENDAERAVRAAMEISQAVRNLEFADGLVLQTRIGIATGRVFVGDLMGNASAIAGDTLNLAARLQDEASADSVVVAAGTKRLIENVAELDPRGARSLRGFAEPVDIWTVTALREAGDRSRSSGGSATRGLIGRDSELTALKRLWHETVGGDGRVAVISGEPGIGKSHLVQAMNDYIRREDHRRRRYFCTPFHENSALYPVMAQIARTAEFGDDEDANARLTKLENLFSGNREAVPLVASLLSIPYEDRYPKLELTNIQQKFETFAALETQLVEHAKQSPILILVEDAHWADPTTLELLTRVATNIVPHNRVFLVVTHRSSDDLGWTDQAHVETLKLERLSAEDSRKIVTEVIGDASFGLETLHDILEKGDGVPLFIEELSRAVDEARTAKESARPVSPTELPTTLEDSLRARIDRLSAGKPLAQMAAVIGRRFSRSLLQSMLDMNAGDFERGIEELFAADIVVASDDTADDYLVFRHALIQQAAYSSLLRRQRQEFHGRIAAALLHRYPSLAETEPETLARHYSGAGESAQAIQFLTIAGQRATSRAAQVEAINHFNAALDHLMQLPESRERSEQEVLLRALLGGALMAVRGFAAPEVYESFARARELCLELGDSPMFCACLYGLLTVNASRSNRADTIALADEMMQVFGDSPVPSWAIAANFSAGYVKLFQGRFDAAEAHFDKAIALYSADQHETLVEQFGDDLAEFSMCYLQWLHLLKGDIEHSAHFLDRAETMANELNNRNAQTRALSFRMGRLQELGLVEPVSEIAPEVVRISTEQGYPYWASAGQIGLGWSLAHTGQAEQGVEIIRGCLAFFDMIGQKTPQTYWRTYLVTALIKAGRRAEALQEVEAALEQCETGLDSFYASELMRLKGEAMMLDPADAGAAEACFRDAVATAEQSGSNLHLLNSQLSLSQHMAATGRGTEARPGLQAAIAKIKCDDEFPVLHNARTLLENLN